MTEYTVESIYAIFEKVRKRISNELLITKVKPTLIVVRSDIKNVVEASNFIGAFEGVTRARYRVCFTKTTHDRSSVRKKWTCRRTLNRDPASVHAKCPAKIQLFIKDVTKRGLIKDPFLRKNPPFRAEIKIVPNHSHLLLEYDSSRYIKISSPVKECFIEYFKRGLTGVKAKLFHEQKLQKVNFHALDDISMNPSIHAIHALYNEWKKLNKKDESNKVPVSKAPASMQIMNGQTNSMLQSTSQNSIINSNIICKLEVDAYENTNFDNISNNVLQQFDQDDNDLKPILNIKKEIVDEEDLPVIESYGSVVTPSTGKDTQCNSAPVRVNSVNTQIVVYDKPSNTYKVLKYLAVGHTHSVADNSYLPRTLLLPRVSVHRV